MSLDILERVMRTFIDAAQKEVSFCFQGGEPLLAGKDFYKEVLSLQKRINTKKIKIRNCLQTNGMLLDEAWCDFFVKNHFLIGVSLDGIEATHDAHRRTATGEPTYQRILRNIEMMNKAGVDFHILTVVTRHTSENIREIFQDYQRRGFFFQQYIACRDPFGISSEDHKPFLSAMEYGQFLVNLFDMWMEAYRKGKAPYIRQFENYLAMIMGISPENCEQCGNCGVTYAIEAGGEVYPCDFYMMDDFCLGNIRNCTLEEIDQKRQELHFIRNSTRFSNKCKKCPYINLCRNGCQRNRVPEEEGAWINRYCEGYQYFFFKRLPDLLNVVQ